MLKVLHPTSEDNGETSEGAVPTLDELVREGARRVLMAALEAEVEQYIDAHRRARRRWSASGSFALAERSRGR